MIHVWTTSGVIYVLDLYSPVKRWLRVVRGELNARGILHVFPKLRKGEPLSIEGTLWARSTGKHIDFWMTTHPIERIEWIPTSECGGVCVE